MFGSSLSGQNSVFGSLSSSNAGNINTGQNSVFGSLSSLNSGGGNTGQNSVFGNLSSSNTGGFNAFNTTTTANSSNPSINIGFSSNAFSLANTNTSTVVTTSANMVSLSTSTSVTSSVNGKSGTTSGSNMTFRQLNEFVNRSVCELEEQERVLLDQATKINAWDRQLLGNAKQIAELNELSERVKNIQEHANTELNFISSQQQELENTLAPLEECLRGLPANYHQYCDKERDKTMQMAVTIDSQLMKMADDLNEMIEQINAFNKPKDESDPMVMISKVLNAHMDSLQWVEESTTALQRHLSETSELVQHQQTNHV